MIRTLYFFILKLDHRLPPPLLFLCGWESESVCVLPLCPPPRALAVRSPREERRDDKRREEMR